PLLVFLLELRSADPAQRALEKADRARMELVARFLRCLAFAGAGMRSLEDDAELVAGENAVPFDMAHVARGARAVMLHEFIRRRKTFPGTDADRARGGTFALRPGGEKPAEIEQRVTDGGEFPVDD